MENITKISLIVAVSLSIVFGIYYFVSPNNLPKIGGQFWVKSATHATTSISVCARSDYYSKPTSTDPSAPTLGIHNPWVCATTTYAGTPDEIPNLSGNNGVEYCIDAENGADAIRFWLTNATGTDKKMGVGVNSNGILLTAGNCWDSREYGIIVGTPPYAIASTTTSTIRYTIF